MEIKGEMRSNLRPENIVFLLGFPRSGTTWVSNLINAHPDVLYRHELVGRAYERFGKRLFNSLKFENGLSDADFDLALRVAIGAHPDTDRPPFFKKSYVTANLLGIRKSLWVLAHSNEQFAKLYAYLYTPRNYEDTHLVIKETRSSANLQSIIYGMRSDKTIILIRHPYSVVASHVSGREAGVMVGFGKERRAEWFAHHEGAPHLNANGIAKEDILNMPDVEFLAINWLLQNLDYLRIKDQQRGAVVLAYEDFLKDPFDQTERLMRFLGIGWTNQVEEFIRASTVETNVSLFKKDASNDYFSVFRGTKFDPKKWKMVLKSDELSLIDKHCETFITELNLFDLADFDI